MNLTGCQKRDIEKGSIDHEPLLPLRPVSFLIGAIYLNLLDSPSTSLPPSLEGSGIKSPALPSKELSSLKSFSIISPRVVALTPRLELDRPFVLAWGLKILDLALSSPPPPLQLQIQPPLLFTVHHSDTFAIHLSIYTCLIDHFRSYRLQLCQPPSQRRM